MRPFVPQVAVGEEKMNKIISSTGQSFITIATQLGVELNTISVIKNYKNAQQKLNSDAGAMDLIRKLSAARKELSEKQQSGTFTPDSLKVYSTIQNEVEKNQTILEYSQTQQEAVQFLKNVNLEISQSIGIDFSSLIKRSNTC
jgi:cell fate (sporulation/competence/biofilm development) regulator YlbF (YheA/YmcA/DUF963 family)